MVVRNLKHNGCDELDGNLTKHERDFKIKAFLFLDIIEVVSKSLDFHYRRYSKKYSRFELIRRHQSNDDMLGQCWNWIRTGSKTVGNAFPSRQNTATNTNMGFVTDGQPRKHLLLETCVERMTAAVALQHCFLVELLRSWDRIDCSTCKISKFILDTVVPTRIEWIQFFKSTFWMRIIRVL